MVFVRRRIPEMEDVSTRQPRSTAPADLHRLAALAHQRGLRVSESGANRWFCTSKRDPSALHAVTGYSCDCRGFQEHQRCTHYALLLDHLGLLPALETEDAPALVPAFAQCPNCSGGGVISVPECAVAGWPHPPCPECQGTGELPAVAPLARAA
jgi:hypothetical protein